MACPFFKPTVRLDVELWPHRQRLPLGDGFAGTCEAPGFEGIRPSDEELKELCNLGYAQICPRLPGDRKADAVRFAVARDAGLSIRLHYSVERQHAPVEHGTVEYDCVRGCWLSTHSDSRMQTMAACYLTSYLGRHPRERSAGV